MKAKEFIEDRYRHNSWEVYPPSKGTVIRWLEEYANLKKSEKSKPKETDLWEGYVIDTLKELGFKWEEGAKMGNFYNGARYPGCFKKGRIKVERDGEGGIDFMVRTGHFFFKRFASASKKILSSESSWNKAQKHIKEAIEKVKQQ